MSTPNAQTLEQLASTFGARIRQGKHSHARIAAMCAITLEQARELANLVRPRRKPAVKNEPDFNDFAEAKYYYNQDTSTYVFSPSDGQFIAPKATVDGLVRAYSNMAGTPATMEQLTRTFPFTRTQIKFILRALNHTHDAPPFTKEDMDTKTDEEIIGSVDFEVMRRQRLIRTIEQGKWDALRKDAQKWVEFETHTLQVITKALEGRDYREPPDILIDHPQFDYAAVIGLSDFHWGKYSDAKENFEGFDRETASQRLASATGQIIRYLALFGKPERIYIPIGSDFFHIDTHKGTTTDGTQQDTDGTLAEILETGIALLEDWIDTVKGIAPVELVLMSGNHDRTMGLAALLALEGVYRKDPYVTVNRTRTPRVYVSFGKNLIGFIHGDGVKRTEDIALLMAQEASTHWGACPHRTAYTGHLHHEKTETDTAGSVVRRQLPSLAGTDRWHALNGYTGAPKSLPVYLHDKSQGLIGLFHARPR